MVYAISKRIFWPVLSLFIKRINGLENLPNKPFILASNHTSYIDGVLLMFLIAWHKNMKLCTFATNQKFNGSFWNVLFNHFGAIRVNGSVEKGVNALRQGNCLGIFPEGGRTYTEQMQPITPTGLGVLALNANVPIVPVALNTFHFWNRYQKMPNFKRNIAITFGKPLTFKLKPSKANYKKVTLSAMKEVKKLAGISHSQTTS